MSEHSSLNSQHPDMTDIIKNGTTASVMKDVIEASKDCIIIVDFWAPNCAPCAQLTPALEAAVRAKKGAIKMVKINIDEHPQLAAQFQVQSVPTIYAVKDGQPIDGFQGALPESEIKKFIDKLTGKDTQAEEQLELANESLKAGEAQAAAEIYAQILASDPGNAEAISGLIKCYIAVGEIDTAKQTLEAITDDLKNHPAIESAKAALDLAEKAEDAGDVDDLKSQLETNPDNHQTRFDLAIACNARNHREDAVDELITILRKDMNWQEGTAKAQLLEFFEAWGPNEQVTIEGRKQLSSLMFA